MPIGVIVRGWSSGSRPARREHAPACCIAQVEGGRVEVGGEVADAAMAELEQVADRRLRAALGVEAHGRAPRGLGLHEHDVLVGAERLRRADLEEQVAVHRAGTQRLEGLLLPAAVVGRVDQRDCVSGRLGGALSAAQDAAEERVGDVGHQQRDGARGTQPQGLGGHVGAVAELARAAANVLLRRLGHAAAALAREDERDRRLRDAGGPGDVDARHAVVGGAGDERKSKHAVRPRAPAGGPPARGRHLTSRTSYVVCSYV